MLSNDQCSLRVKRRVTASRYFRIVAPAQGSDGAWQVVVATVVTCLSFTAVMTAMSEAHVDVRVATARVLAPQRESVVFMVQNRPRLPPLEVVSRRGGQAASASRAIDASTAPASSPSPIDTSSSSPKPPMPPASSEVLRASLSPLKPSSRLARPRAPAAPWYTPPWYRNPFKPPPQLTTSERDSVLGELGSEVPNLAEHREEPISERDARAKEAMLKMRLTGRTLLVPPDNSGGLITSRIPLPVLSGGKLSTRRSREDSAAVENRARLERLRQRADSARRARGDSARSDPRP